jgi:hypothetical protein
MRESVPRGYPRAGLYKREFFPLFFLFFSLNNSSDMASSSSDDYALSSDDPASLQGVMGSSLMRWREHSMGKHVILAIVNAQELFSCKEL